VFFAVKIETPRDANTHDGHVKSRGISPPRGLRCLFGQRRLQRAVHGSLPRTRYASRPSACQNGHSPRAPCFPYSARGPSCADWRLAFPTGKIPPQIGGYLVGRWHGFVNRGTFCSCFNDTLSQ